MDITSYITGIISRLGFLDDNVYRPDPDCFYSITELIRFLRTDDAEFTVRRAILAQNPLKNDLLKILLLPDIEEQLFDATLRLTINLMSPAYTLADIKNYEDKTNLCSHLREIDNALYNSLVVFEDENFLNVMYDKISFLTTKPHDDLTEEERVKLERYFMLIRQIFYINSNAVPNFAVEKRDRKVQDKVNVLYIKSGIHKLLMDFAIAERQKEYILPVFSITTLILSIYNASHVATATDSNITKKKLTETEEKILSRLVASGRPQRPSGRSFLGGTYSVKGMKALNSNRDFVVLKPIEDSDVMKNYNDRKSVKAVAKNKRINNGVKIDAFDVPQHVLFEIKNFVTDLIDGAYKKLIKYVIDVAFESTKQGLNKFTDRFFFILNSFIFIFSKAIKLENYEKKLYFNKEFVHLILTRIDYYFESMKMEKENLKQHLKGAEYALGCFENMMIFVKYIGDNLKEEDEHFYKDITSYLFEMQESREMTGNIMHDLGPTQISMPMLHSLIILNEYYMFLMERESKRGVLTQFKRKRKAQSKSRPKKKKYRDETMKRLEKDAVAYSKKYSIEEMDETWSKVSIDIDDIFNGIVETEDPEIFIIDFALDIEDAKERQFFALLKVRRALRECKAQEAIAYYKAGQAFWSNEGEAFADNLNINTLKNIMYLEDLDDAVNSFKNAVKELVTEKPENKEEESDANNSEAVDFNLTEFISKLANFKVLSWYFFVFQNYRLNSEQVNLAILKFFQRIWRELDDPVRLYDVRLFYTFDDIGNYCKKISADELKLKKFNLLYTFAEKFTTEFFNNFKEKGCILINDLWT